MRAAAAASAAACTVRQPCCLGARMTAAGAMIASNATDRRKLTRADSAVTPLGAAAAAAERVTTDGLTSAAKRTPAGSSRARARARWRSVSESTAKSTQVSRMPSESARASRASAVSGAPGDVATRRGMYPRGTRGLSASDSHLRARRAASLDTRWPCSEAAIRHTSRASPLTKSRAATMGNAAQSRLAVRSRRRRRFDGSHECTPRPTATRLPASARSAREPLRLSPASALLVEKAGLSPPASGLRRE
mmetsp:Transcript_19635/g.75365  ORF Transcript_19635/g.75365 Transcript_19635/m.75365 type:complete len:249 (+) Transcript_19635:1376-2122(+)